MRGDTIGKVRRQVSKRSWESLPLKSCFPKTFASYCGKRTFPVFHGTWSSWVPQTLWAASPLDNCFVKEGHRASDSACESGDLIYCQLPRAQERYLAFFSGDALGRHWWPPRSMPHRTEGLFFCQDYLITGLTNKRKNSHMRQDFKSRITSVACGNNTGLCNKIFRVKKAYWIWPSVKHSSFFLFEKEGRLQIRQYTHTWEWLNILWYPKSLSLVLLIIHFQKMTPRGQK
jgi:hypothetical protein